MPLNVEYRNKLNYNLQKIHVIGVKSPSRRVLSSYAAPSRLNRRTECRKCKGLPLHPKSFTRVQLPVNGIVSLSGIIFLSELGVFVKDKRSAPAPLSTCMGIFSAAA